MFTGIRLATDHHAIEAHLEHEQAKVELKSLVPEDAKDVRAKHS
jgi:hypothetical protein